MADILRYVNFDPETLANAYRQRFANSKLPASEQHHLLAEVVAGLEGYTYLEE